MRYRDFANPQPLDEIVKGGYLDDHDFIDNLPGKDLSSDQLDLFKEIPSGEPKIPNGYEFVGRMGALYVAKPADRAPYVSYVWFTQKEAIGYVMMAPYDQERTNYPRHAPPAPDLHGVGFRVHAVQVAEKFKGQRLGPEMYRWLLTNVCDYIMADDTQTLAGAALWKNLQRTPGLTVEVWDGNNYDSRPRRRGRDFSYVYEYNHLIPWVTLDSKLDFVRLGEE